MIWIFEKSNGELLLISAKTEDEALNHIKSCGWELVHGELHTELKFKTCAPAVIVKNFTRV